MSREAGIARYYAKKDAKTETLAKVIETIDQHIPSLTDEINEEMNDAFAVDGIDDWADFAIRRCHCGQRIDGFYEYVDHLKATIAPQEVTTR